MNELEMTITIKLNSNDFQNICELNEILNDSNKKNEDDYTLNLQQKMFVSKILFKLKDAGKRKASRLEAIGTEFINSLR